MGTHRISPQAGNPVPAYLKAGCGLLAVALLVVTYRYGGIRYFEPLGIPTASLALNQFTVV